MADPGRRRHPVPPGPRRRLTASPDLLALVASLIAGDAALEPHRGGWRDSRALGHVHGLLVIEGRALGWLSGGERRVTVTALGRTCVALAAASSARPGRTARPS